ncbi:hypothetical protein [Acidovorax sp. SRB_24]|uniref:hypothetical protein n=1 Tax=Acidovorax sp. SRB_24 TaxID=1962700 RepID=UPI00145E4CF5|nr:hypothetical protein [Acidovorax sp. SRB_24]
MNRTKLRQSRWTPERINLLAWAALAAAEKRRPSFHSTGLTSEKSRLVLMVIAVLAPPAAVAMVVVVAAAAVAVAVAVSC